MMPGKLCGAGEGTWPASQTRIEGVEMSQHSTSTSHKALTKTSTKRYMIVCEYRWQASVGRWLGRGWATALFG